MNAHDLIRRDHDKVRDSYAAFESATGEEQTDIGTRILTDLTVHTVAEEEIYYPALDSAGEKDLAEEYRAEHAAAKALISKLSTMDASDPEYLPTMKALMEAVEDHMEEEESEGFPAVEAILAESDLERIGTEMEQREGELEESAIKRLWAAITS
jgi:hemerythrin superfamily protein